MTTKRKSVVKAVKKNVVPKECRLKNEEMETHISFDPVTKTWGAWSTIRKDVTKFKKQGWTLIKTEYYTDGKVYSARFEAPENAISIRAVKGVEPVAKPKSNRKPLSEEQKAKMRAGRLAKKLAAEKSVA